MQSHSHTHMRAAALFGVLMRMFVSCSGTFFMLHASFVCHVLLPTDYDIQLSTVPFILSLGSKNLRIKIRRYRSFIRLCHGSDCWSPTSLFGLDLVPICGIFVWTKWHWDRFISRHRSTAAPFFEIHISLTLYGRKNRLRGAECLRSC